MITDYFLPEIMLVRGVGTVSEFLLYLDPEMRSRYIHLPTHRIIPHGSCLTRWSDLRRYIEGTSSLRHVTIIDRPSPKQHNPSFPRFARLPPNQPPSLLSHCGVSPISLLFTVQRSMELHLDGDYQIRPLPNLIISIFRTR